MFYYYVLGGCLLLLSFYVFGSSAKLFFKVHRADPNAGWRAAGLAAAESPINTLLCGLLILLSIRFNLFSVFWMLLPIMLLLFSCGKLIWETAKLEKMTTYLGLSIARIASAAISLTLLLLAAHFDLMTGNLGGYSILVALITALLTVATMYKSWRMKTGKEVTGFSES